MQLKMGMLSRPGLSVSIEVFIFTLLLWLLPAFVSFSQTREEGLIALEKDSSKVEKLYSKSSNLLTKSRQAEALQLNLKGIQLASEKGLNKLYAEGCFKRSLIFNTLGEFDSANYYANACINVSVKYGFAEYVGKGNNQLGNILVSRGDGNKGLSNYLIALEVFQVANHLDGIVTTNMLIANHFLMNEA